MSSYVIDDTDLELNDFKENIPRIGFRDTMVSAPGIKYRWSIKGNNIEIYVLSLIWRVIFNILGRDI